MLFGLRPYVSMYIPTGCAARKPAAAESPSTVIDRSPEPSHVAEPFTAPEMLTVRAFASFSAVSAFFGTVSPVARPSSLSLSAADMRPLAVAVASP